MTDPPRRDGADPNQPTGPGYPSYPAYSDPAYAGQTPYGPTYQAPYAPPPTEQLPQYGPYGYDPYTTAQYGAQYPPGEPPGPPPPDEPKSPRWLWVMAAVAVLLVVGMVIALVVANSSRQETVVAPPPMPEPTTTTRTPTTTPRALPPIIPAPTPTPPSESVTPGDTETVVYEVNGDGRAINITYVDTGSLLQTEFNVMLPWSKEVELPSPAEDSASVTIINVGRNVTCSVSINGVQVQQSTGAGLTICTALR
jgi:heme/copper-type cytochrome/quinol oxidase subunit 2